MKNLKKAIAAISLFICLMLMCSCMRMEAGIIINGDGTGRVFNEITMSEATLTQMEMTKEDFLKSISESEDNDKYEDWNMEEVERTVPGEIEDETYVGVRYYKDGKLDELVSALSDSEDGSNITYDMKSENGNLELTINMFNDSDGSVGGEVNEYISQGMMKVYFTVTVPTEIVGSNGTISEDKKTATWDILSLASGADKEKTMRITFKEKSPFLLILIIMGGVLLAAAIAGVIIVALSKRKYRPRNAGNMQSNTVYSGNSFTVNQVSPSEQPVEAAAPVQPEAPVTAQPAEAAENVQSAEAAAPEQSEAAEEKPKFCTNCGAKIEYEAAFCMSCGEQIKK